MPDIERHTKGMESERKNIVKHFVLQESPIN